MTIEAEQSVRIVDVPFVIRGRVIEECDVEHRAGGIVFRTPDPHDYLMEIPLRSRTGMSDLHEITIDEIIEFLGALGERLNLRDNEYLQECFSLTVSASNLTEPVLREIYDDQLAQFFQTGRMKEAVERRLGVPYVEGWVREPDVTGRNARVRAFGARATHVVAGNGPGVSAQTIVRNALTRSDAIIKTPANDPVTAIAILRTMIDLDMDHPVTKHVSALYWRGGDELVEQVAFSSPNIDKIVAWGGSSAIKHAAKFVGPGVELVALDPKISISLLGTEVLTAADVGREAARRLALDVGLMNQEGCVSSRVAYVDVDGVTDPDDAVRRFATSFFEQLQLLPSEVSTPVAHLPAELRDEVEAALLIGEPEVIGGGTGAGGVLISWDGQPVDYITFLAARYLNLVPVGGFDSVMEGISSTTQTCGVYPPSLRLAIRNELAMAGVQRVKTLGASGGDNQAVPQDGVEVLRRMCRWIVDDADPAEDEGSGS